MPLAVTHPTALSIASLAAGGLNPAQWSAPHTLTGFLDVENGGTGATTAAAAAENLGLGATDTPQFAAIELGHASDTTITRSAAGLLAVEGGIIPKENRANTFTAAQTINANAANVLTISNGLSGGTPSSTHGKLVIDSADANIGMQILGSTTSNQRILFGDTDANSRGQIEYAHSFDTMTLYTAGTSRLSINGSGNIGLGGTAFAIASVYVPREITGGTTAYSIYNRNTIMSDVTAAAVGIFSNIGTDAASFTVPTLYHFAATQNTLGAGSAVTSQSGFYAYGTIREATDNYSFHAANTSLVGSGKTSYGFYSAINIATGGGTTWAFYASGTAWSQLSGPLITADTHWVDAPPPTAKSAAATLTGAEIKTYLITCTGTTYTLTLPTGTNIDAAFSGVPSTVNMAFDFHVVNNASGVVTIAVNTGVTSSGTLTVAAAASAHFRLRRTAANTYVVYRIA